MQGRRLTGPGCPGLTGGLPGLTGRACRGPLLCRARLVALAAGGCLLPWCLLLSMTLPATAQAQHWSLVWAGLDAAEAVAALATALLLARGDSRAALTAVAGGALLLTDAWFDVCTSAPGLDYALATGRGGFRRGTAGPRSRLAGAPAHHSWPPVTACPNPRLTLGRNGLVSRFALRAQIPAHVDDQLIGVVGIAPIS